MAAIKINQKISKDKQQRFNTLIAKRDNGKIEKAELEELIELTDFIEMKDAERLEQLAKLAHQKNMPLRTLIKQFGF